MRPPEPLLAALQELGQGKPFPRVWVATWDAARGPQNRTVRVLAYNWLQASLTFAAHADHGLVRQSKAEPRAQICMLREEPLLQVRLDATLTAQPGSSHPHGERLWQKLSPGDKVRLYQGHPQRPSLPPTFWLVDARWTVVEVLRLAEENYSRTRYTLGSHEWTAQSYPI